MLKKTLILTFFVLLVFPYKANSGFSLKKTWKGITSIPNKIGGFIVGASGIGGAIGGAFEPTINRYEEANRKSINLLDEKLNLRLLQFNDILAARQEQLDEIFKTSIYLMDESIKTNIDKIDESMKNRIGQLNSGLTNVSYGFSSALWTIFRGVATLLLSILLLYFILDFITRFNMNKASGSSTENRILKMRLALKSVAILVGFAFIFFFQPTMFKHFRDPAFQQQINAIESRLITSSESLNYDECIYYSSLLTSYEVENPKYQYYLIKYSILRDFIYRPKLTLFSLNNIQELQSKLVLLEKYKTDTEAVDKEFHDGDFEVINALFFSNVFDNKEGDLIAAFLSNSAMLKNKEFSLKPLALDFISRYEFHPLDPAYAVKILKRDSILLDDEPMPNLSIGDEKGPQSAIGSVLYTNYTYNSLIKKLLESDEQDFIKFIDINTDKEKKQKIGKAMISRWVKALKTIDTLGSVSAAITSRALSLNDSYVNYVIRTLEDYKVSLTEVMEPLQVTSISALPDNVPAPLITNGVVDQTKYNSTLAAYSQIKPIRRYLTSKFLVQFNFLSRIPFINKSLNEIKMQETAIDSLCIKYARYQNQRTILRATGDITNFKVYAECIRSLADQDIYQPGRKLTLAQAIYKKMETDIPSVKDDLKPQYRQLRIELDELMMKRRPTFI